MLQHSGGYRRVLGKWPPAFPETFDSWVAFIGDVGRRWRAALGESKKVDLAVPSEVSDWWKIVLHSQVEVPAVSESQGLLDALLQLAAAADEAAARVGVPREGGLDTFESDAREQLNMRGTSLCRGISTSKIRVLPKFHTPQSGITVRSLSHNLALVRGSDLVPDWHIVPGGPNQHSLNLLIVPWPKTVRPSQFVAVDTKIQYPANTPPSFGYFHYRIEENSWEMRTLCDRARDTIGRSVDGVIFPELSLTPEMFRTLSADVTPKGAFFLAGVGTGGHDGKPAQNFVEFAFQLGAPKGYTTSLRQPKHHRWLLDKRQIVQYGLGATLDPSRNWWEYTDVGRRQLLFVGMRPWLTFCCLICEDLARQDPASEMIRAVGPNLVVALLLDGPQLATRWGARYATVLADDPGSSVLTLTCLGMAMLSGSFQGTGSRSRVIGLWKDARSGGPVPLELPEGAEALVLSLAVEYAKEWTADGREDEGRAGFPVLVGVHPIR